MAKRDTREKIYIGTDGTEYTSSFVMNFIKDKYKISITRQTARNRIVRAMKNPEQYEEKILDSPKSRNKGWWKQETESLTVEQLAVMEQFRKIHEGQLSVHALKCRLTCC